MGATALTPAGLPYDLVSILALSARMAVGIALFSWQLPRREGFSRRVALLLLAWAAGVALFVVAGLHVGAPSPVGSALLQLALFSMVLLGCTAAVRALFDASVWVALFCSTAGYTAQNLASGTGELVFSLLPFLGIDPHAPTVALITWALSAVAVFVPSRMRPLSCMYSCALSWYVLSAS